MCKQKPFQKEPQDIYKLLLFKKLFLKSDYKFFMRGRRRIISSAVIFRANLLRTRMMRATGVSREVPMCRLVICRMHLSFMVKLCSEDKTLLDFGVC
jgi:hypothetical protein